MMSPTENVWLLSHLSFEAESSVAVPLPNALSLEPTKALRFLLVYSGLALTLSFQVWCLQPLQPLAKLEHEASSDRGKEVLGVDYSPDGSMIVTSSHGGEVVVWASKDFSRISTFHMWDRVYRVRFSVDAQYVICGGLSPVFSLAHAFVRRRPDCCLSWRQVGYCFRARVCRCWRWFRGNGSRSDSANGRYGSC